MICQICGKENEEGMRFCSACGAALIDEPIELDLEQIQIPAASRKAHIVKVSATKKSDAPEQPAGETPEEEISPEEAIESAATPEMPEVPEAPAATDNGIDPTQAPMTMKNWLPVFLLCMLPGINFIMLLVWAFSKKCNASKKSFARLMLIFFAVMLVLAVAALFVYAAFFNKNLLGSFSL